MSTEIIATKLEDSFEYRMKTKIKESIGDLLTDADLSKMVNRSMEEVFFTKRPNPKKNAYYNSSEPDFLDPFLHSIVKELLQPAVNEAVKEYIKNNSVLVNHVIKEVISNGVGNAVITAMNSQFQGQLLAFQSSIQQQLASR